jgi:hypothetical protein
MKSRRRFLKVAGAAGAGAYLTAAVGTTSLAVFERAVADRCAAPSRCGWIAVRVAALVVGDRRVHHCRIVGGDRPILDRCKVRGAHQSHRPRRCDLWLPGSGTNQPAAAYERDVDRALARVAAAEPIGEGDLAHLALPMRRYLRTTGVVGQPRVHNFRARMHGRIRNGPEGRWIPFAAEQYHVIDERAGCVLAPQPDRKPESGRVLHRAVRWLSEGHRQLPADHAWVELTVRLYCARKPLLDGSRQFPEAQPVNERETVD